MRIYSWNVNGIRSAEVSFLSFIKNYKPDILFLQEVRAHSDQISYFVKNIEGYNSVFNDSGKAGYGGTAVYWKNNLDLHIDMDIGNDFLKQEGRCMKVIIKDLNILNIYVPNGNSNEQRLQYKLKFLSELGTYMRDVCKSDGKLVVSGDFNIAHKDIDTFAYKTAKISGFLPEERKWMDSILNGKFIDTFRIFNKEDGNYTWWHMKDRTREKNKGWRYDYFIVSEDLKARVKKSEILRNVFGSDHCPILLEVGL